MEISARTWLIIGASLVVGYFLLRGKSGGGVASNIAAIGGSTTGDPLVTATGLAQAQMDNDLKLKTLAANTDIAKAQIAASSAATQAQLANQTQLAQIAASVSNNQTSSATVSTTAQIQAYLEAQKAQIKAYQDAQSAAQNRALFSTLGNLGTSVIGNIFGDGWGYDPFGGFIGGF